MNSLRSIPLVGLLCLLAQASLCPTSAAQDASDAQEMGPRNVNPRLAEIYNKWLPLDHVAIVVNGDIVTQQKIIRKVSRVLERVPASTQEEVSQIVNQTHLREIESLLIRQAGEDMGLPAEAVAAHVSGMLRDQTDEAGGSFAMSERLREDSTTALEFKEDRSARVYEDSFRRRIAGLGGTQERTPEDRYVRPGQLIQRYLRIVRTGEGIQALQGYGAIPATYELQILLITPRDESTTMKQSRARADELHAALLAGKVDWDEMLDKFGAFANSGLMGPQPMRFLEHFHDPGDGQLVQFAAEGPRNGLSRVMAFPEINPATRQRRLAGFAIYKLLDRSSATVPEFDSKDVQFTLQDSIEREASRVRMDDAVTELGRTAYIWSPSHDAQVAEQKKAQAERTLRIKEAREKNAEKLRQRAQAPAESAPTIKP